MLSFFQLFMSVQVLVKLALFLRVLYTSDVHIASFEAITKKQSTDGQTITHSTQ